MDSIYEEHTSARILVGPPEQRLQIEVDDERYGDVRRRPITVRPAYRVLSQPDGMDLIKLQLSAFAQAAWTRISRMLRAWRPYLDHPKWRAVYRIVRRAKLEVWLAVEEDRRWLQVALIALAALIVYAIVIL